MSAIGEVVQYLRAAPPLLPAADPKANNGRLPPSAAMTRTSGAVRGSVASAALFRNWAEHSEWVRAAIDLRKNQVARAEWDIGPINDELPYSEPLAAQIEATIRSPNPKDKIYDTFIERVVEDYLVLDAGCFEMVENVRGQICQLWPVDGATIQISKAWDGTDPDEWRYRWVIQGQVVASWLDTEFVYMMDTATTYQTAGLSKLETLKIAIDSELGTSAYNDRQMRSAAPDGMLDLGENARPDQVEQFRNFWANEVAGRGAMAILGGSRNPSWIPFRSSNRDMQFAEWQLYLVRKICAVFGINLMDLGFHGDVNRANAVVQQQNTEDRGTRPLLGDVSAYMTANVVHHPSFGGPANNLGFRYKALNLKQSQAQSLINKAALAGGPWHTIDEARVTDGYPPIGGKIGGSLIWPTPQGPVILDDSTPTAGEAHEAANARPVGPKVPAPTEKDLMLVGAGMED